MLIKSVCARQALSHGGSLGLGLGGVMQLSSASPCSQLGSIALQSGAALGSVRRRERLNQEQAEPRLVLADLGDDPEVASHADAVDVAGAVGVAVLWSALASSVSKDRSSFGPQSSPRALFGRAAMARTCR